MRKNTELLTYRITIIHHLCSLRYKNNRFLVIDSRHLISGEDMATTKGTIADKEEAGLSENEAKEKLQYFGVNLIVKPAEVNFFDIAKEEITEPMILLLLAVVVFYFFLGSFADTLTILGIVIVLVLVEIYNEYRAKKAINALSKVVDIKARVIRNGIIVEIKSLEVVPGDVLILTPGTQISADSKIIRNFNLQIDEQSLTGESLPIEKDITDEVYAGTLVVSGEGRARVFATGKNTKLGKIAELAKTIKQPKTPLQLEMKTLAITLAKVAIVFSISIPLLGYLEHQDIRQMILTGLALAFAVIPEELPIIITMVLGLGAYRLSKKNLLIKKIRAVETLGCASVILTDKTGTITESSMQVTTLYPPENDKNILTNAFYALTETSLSPTDKAIRDKIVKAALPLTSQPEEILYERMFGDRKKTRSVIRKLNGSVKLFVIGAPEEILPFCKDKQADIEQTLNTESLKGRRIIAVAKRTLSSIDTTTKFSDLEKDFEEIGLISLEDPPRTGVKETLEVIKNAGIRTIMVTGDHPKTAMNIATAIGIDGKKILTGNDLDTISDDQLKQLVTEVNVFARTVPEHIYRLVKILQENHNIVAVTGDGVNDSLALKGANIGIAMGIRGTDVAKEVADIVLADDNYNTIGLGVFEGRKLYDNLRKGIKFYLSAKLALILIFLVPILLNIPFPLTPIQIILLELFMDLGASAGFVVEPEEKTIYTRLPRNPTIPLFNRKLLGEIFLGSVSLFIAVFGSYAYALGQNLSVNQAKTMAFAAWIIGHIFLALVFRSEHDPLYKIGIFSNKVIILWGLLAYSFLFVVIGIPVIGAYFKITPLSIDQFVIIFVLSIIGTCWLELKKILQYYTSKPKPF